MGDIVLERSKGHLVRADSVSEGWTRRMVVQVVPEAIGSGGSSCITNKDVLWVGYPKGGWDLVGVEKRGGSSGQHPKVIIIHVISFNSILLRRPNNNILKYV